MGVVPAGAFPRLERAFARSAGAGMLDLLRHGLPLGAGAFPAWLRERTQELCMQHLRQLRRGENDFPQLSARQAAAWLEGMGIPAEPIREDKVNGGRFTFFKDPDGLPLEIHE